MRKVTFSIFLIGFSMTALAEEDTQTNAQIIQEQYTKPKDEPGAILFTPPEGWRLVDPKEIPGNSIKAMVLGKGKGAIPPTISLGIDNFQGTLKEYLKKIKAINESHGDEWKDLGPIQTEAGQASLSQVDIDTQWGKIRAMHVVFIKDGVVYILTTSAMRDEFSQFYPQFFNVMRSLRMNKTIEEMNSEKKNSTDKRAPTTR